MRRSGNPLIHRDVAGLRPEVEEAVEELNAAAQREMRQATADATAKKTAAKEALDLAVAETKDPWKKVMREKGCRMGYLPMLATWTSI